MALAIRLAVLAVFHAGCVAGAAEELITTWRGHGYQGVMPATGLVRRFICYDADGPDPDAICPKDDRHSHKILKPLAGDDWPTPGTRHKVCWRTPLPSWGQSTPVVVGDKVFVTCDAILQTQGQHVLVCVDVASGTVDWTRPIDHLLAWEDQAKVAEVQQIRMAEVEGWAEAMRTWNAVWWDNERDSMYGSTSDRPVQGFGVIKHRMKGGPHADRQAHFDAAKEAGYKAIDRGYHQHTGRFGHPDRIAMFKRAARARARIYSHNKDAPWYGSTMASVVGDGAAVYAVAWPDAVVSYDFAGELRWAADMAVGSRPKGSWCSGVHRLMTSPVLVDDILVVFNTTARIVFGYARGSGELRWKTVIPGDSGEPSRVKWDYVDGEPRGYGGHMGPGGTPVPLHLVDGEATVPVVVIPSGHAFAVGDGRFLGWFNPFHCEADSKDKKGRLEINVRSSYGTGVLVDDDIYVSVHGVATRLGLENGKLTAERLWMREEDNRGSIGHGGNQSLTVAPGKGIVAAAGYGGSGQLWDLASGDLLTKGLRRGGGDGYTSGCISADGLVLWHAGFWGPRKYRLAPVFSMVPLDQPDAYGLGVIIESGTNELPDFEQRLIDRFGVTRIHSGWPHPTAFGNRIFVRTNTYLYCFGEGEWQAPDPGRYRE